MIEFRKIEIINNISNDVVDGVNIINLFKPHTELGKQLCPFVIEKPLEFLKWKFYNTKNLMDFLRLDGYKEEWLNMKNHNSSLKKEINNLKPKNIPSYWGIICLFIISKIKDNKHCIDLLKNNTLPFNMYIEEQKEVLLFGSKFKIKKKLPSFHGYCKVIAFVEQIVKEDILNNEEELIKTLNSNFPTLKEDIDKLVSL